MLKILSFRTLNVRGFLIFSVLNAKNLTMMSTLCQIYAFYNKCDVLTFKRNLFYFSFFKKKKCGSCVWHIATWAFLVISKVLLVHNKALPLFNLIFTKLIDNIIIYYIIMETITSYITTYSLKKKSLI